MPFWYESLIANVTPNIRLLMKVDVLKAFIYIILFLDSFYREGFVVGPPEISLFTESYGFGVSAGSHGFPPVISWHLVGPHGHLWHPAKIFSSEVPVRNLTEGEGGRVNSRDIRLAPATIRGNLREFWREVDGISGRSRPPVGAGVNVAETRKKQRQAVGA